MKVYVASSWRNTFQQEVVRQLRQAGHEVYDFMNPGNGSQGFKWSELDKDWEKWDNEEFRAQLLCNPIAAKGFMSDFRAMRWCDAIVMVLPCGNSAHMELGYGTGAGKRTVILLDATTKPKPDLMYLQADSICLDVDEVLQVLGPTLKG